jgi:tetratricopeptide (TPR) repeat protein
MRDQVDEIWTPSQYSKECFVRAGIPEDRVLVIPNGVDVSAFSPEARPIALPTEKRFKFLFVGGTIKRKGIDVLLRAYSQAFGGEDDVCLVIKDMGVGTLYPGQSAEAQIQAYREHPGRPEIIYLQEELATDSMSSLYTACDCLVHPFRGEGFGLPIAEAMACGVPVIVSRWVPALEFCDEDRAYFIDGEQAVGVQNRYADMELTGPVIFFEPDAEDLARKMRYVLDHPEEARAKGYRGLEYVKDNLTWNRMYQRVLERIQGLKSKPIRRYDMLKLNENAAHPQRGPTGDDPEQRLRQGEALFQEGRLQESEATFREVLSVHPDHAIAHSNLAGALWDQGQHEEALRHLIRAMEIAPDDRDVIWNLGQILVALGRHDEVMQIYSEYLDAHPEEWEMEAMLRQWQMARFESFHETRQRDDDSEPVVLNARDYTGSAPQTPTTHATDESGNRGYESMTWSDPPRISSDQLDEVCRRGEDLANMGCPDEAKEIFWSIIETQPAYASAFSNLACLHWQEGKIQEAIETVARAIELAPDDQNVVWNCGQILQGVGREAEARRLYQSFLERHPERMEFAEAVY